MKPLDFIHDMTWVDLPNAVQAAAKRSLLDLIGVGIGGAETRLSHIVRDLSVAEFGGKLPMFMDGRSASASGVALAAGMTIDALDGHDGYNPAKGHIGCPLFAALLPLAMQNNVSGIAFLESLTVGYEFGARASVAQHDTVPDYHTSGSWGAVTGAAACARLISLDHEQTRHALGIAEYHGPRSQMMRCIDHPTMVKDGAGWGAMTAVTSVALAKHGFTGAPAITVEQSPAHWATLGSEWEILNQYYKPYPVCRWAQAPIAGVLALRAAHGLTSTDVIQITVTTFHAAVRLATAIPRNTEEAQYSTSFPCAVAMVRGGVGAADIADEALNDTEVLRLSQSLIMHEALEANDLFPNRRIAKVSLELTDGRIIHGDWHEPQWDPTAPPTPLELKNKYDELAIPVGARAAEIADIIDTLDQRPFSDLADLICQPISR